MPNTSQLAIARARRGSAGARKGVRWQWFDKEVLGKINLTMKQRMALAVQFLESEVVNNIGRPVTKSGGPRGGTVVTDRSKPGEFPKADTTELMKSIFKQVRSTRGGVEGYVGTPHDYGLILEVRLDRSFLAKTLNETRPMLGKILSRKIK